MKSNCSFKTGIYILCFLCCIQFGVISWSHAQNTRIIHVNQDQSLAKIQPTMWGIFFEDINFGADGGLYGELIKNRSFEFTLPLMGWTIQRNNAGEGELLVVNRKQTNSANPRYIKINTEKGEFAITNEGFKGMGIKKGIRYDFSVMYRQSKLGIKLHLKLIGADNQILGEGDLSPRSVGGDWQKQSVSFYAKNADPKAKLSIVFEGKGKIDLDMFSLFPSDTWKNRPGGMRADLVQKLADLHPGFIRFPGGCIVEGRDLANRYQWKKTIGPIEERQLIMNRWNTEFSYRSAPDYFQSFGLGFFEYFQLAEDIGAEPLPILNCGMACQFNTAEVVSMDQLDPYVQDALDLIEFANGDIHSKWGKVRADLGHPKPFHLKMMGIGNENWGPQYLERLSVFTKAIKSRYPDFKLINSSGTDPQGERFDLLNTSLRASHADLIDEHYYRPAEWFLKNANRYDNYPRIGSKVFVGEYAVHADNKIVGPGRNNWQSALAAASFMTGLERNADVVQMTSYAPLLADVDAWQWAPDLIWFNSMNSYATPDYFVQQLFSINRGTDVVSQSFQGQHLIGQDSLYGSAVTDSVKKELILKIANNADIIQNVSFQFDGKRKFSLIANILQMSSENLKQTNSFDNPEAISPVHSEMRFKGMLLNISLKPYSFTVIKIPFTK